VDGQVDFKVESAVSKGRMKLGLGITPPGRCCWSFVCVFSKRSIGVSPRVSGTFLHFGPFFGLLF